jgi:SAM-dependent methyltransferase
MPSEFDPHSLAARITSLYRDELAERPTGYLEEHAQPKAVRRHVDVFSWYAGSLPESGAVLDWGCNHGPDLCLLREAFGDRFELHGCDFAAPDTYPAFRAHARAEYRQLADPVALPYPSNHFAAVVASGALEHAAMDYESLKELNRVLRPGGLLVVSYLPNRWSFAEWRRRASGGGHLKLYDKRQLRELLLRAGFWTPRVGDHASLPDRFARGGVGAFARRQLRRLASIVPQGHSVLCCLATKRVGF